MNLFIGQAENQNELSFSGELTIGHAAEIKEALRSSLEKADQLVLNFEDAKEVDLSCLQLLCSAHRSCMRRKKQMVIRTMSSDFREAAENAGYFRNIGCILDVSNSCLWINTRHAHAEGHR